MSIRSLFVVLRDEAGVLVHEIVGGHGRAGRFADATEDGRRGETQARRVALHGADGTDTAQPDQVGELPVGHAVQAAILSERHEPRKCGHNGHLVNY
ncbi:MAG: hypothetical protein ACREFJ_05690 [Acetobacteraceae bacterium]